jgi:hypothetical protein
MVGGAVTASINRHSRCSFYEHSYMSSLSLNDCSEIKKKLDYFHPFPLFQLVFLFVLYSNFKTQKLTICVESIYFIIMDTIFKKNNSFPTPRVYPVSNYFSTDMSELWCGWKRKANFQWRLVSVKHPAN